MSTIYPNMPVEEYNALPAMRRSVLKAALEDTEVLRAAIAGNTEDSEALLKGDALHTAALEPDRFEAYYRKWQKVKGKGEIAFDEERKAALAQGIRLYRSDWDVDEIAAALRAHPQSSPMFGKRGLANGQAEMSIVWERDGVPMKIRLDGVWLDRGVVVDIKTHSGSLKLPVIGSAAEDHGYFMQAAMGREALRAATGRNQWRWFNVWVRSEAPWTVRVTEMGETGYSRGEMVYEQAFRAWRRCVNSGDWTAYPSVDELIPPAWAVRELDSVMQEEAA